MSRRYTAQDMRETADDLENYADLDESVISDMLRQAADDMEREEREKKYEYTVIAKRHDGGVFIDTEHFSTLESAKKNAENGFYDVIRYERREVGEWEEVKDAHQDGGAR